MTDQGWRREEAGPAPDAVVLVHGLWMTGLEMLLLRRRLARCGFTPYQFHYRTLRDDLHTNARHLAAFVGEVPGGTVHFVGHSLGGLVIRQFLHDAPALRPGRVVTLGTPHCGAAAATALCRHRVLRPLFGHSLTGLTGGGPPWAGEREFGSIAGDLPIGMGRLLGVVSGPGDGAVAVEETRLPHAQHLVLHASHLGLLLAPRAAQQVCHFLRYGRFASRAEP